MVLFSFHIPHIILKAFGPIVDKPEGVALLFILFKHESAGVRTNFHSMSDQALEVLCGISFENFNKLVIFSSTLLKNVTTELKGHCLTQNDILTCHHAKQMFIPMKIPLLYVQRSGITTAVDHKDPGSQLTL